MKKPIWEYDEIWDYAEQLEAALEQIADMAPRGNNKGAGELCIEYNTCFKMHRIACKALGDEQGLSVAANKGAEQ